MIIQINAKPRSKVEKIEMTGDSQYDIAVKAPPIKGLANQAIINALSDYFDVPKSQIKIVSGFTSKRKIIEIT